MSSNSERNLWHAETRCPNGGKNKACFLDVVVSFIETLKARLIPRAQSHALLGTPSRIHQTHKCFQLRHPGTPSVRSGGRGPAEAGLCGHAPRYRAGRSASTAFCGRVDNACPPTEARTGEICLRPGSSSVRITRPCLDYPCRFCVDPRVARKLPVVSENRRTQLEVTSLLCSVHFLTRANK